MSATVQPQTVELQSVHPQTDETQTDEPSSYDSFKDFAKMTFFGIAGLKLYFEMTSFIVDRLVDFFYPIPETPETLDMRRAKNK